MTAEGYRRAQQAKAERRRRLRTRGGVVDLSEWRDALGAERFAREIVGGLAQVASIRVRPAEDVGFVLEIALLQDEPTVRLCLPTAVDEIPVRVRVPRAGPGAPPRRGG